ncbi:MAG: HlyC/CorC family transporter [Candidatus Omnitrophica bacterium]|nr:HlyC/CorC family transporter [Candidatus Omnitrophota bacterium]
MALIPSISYLILLFVLLGLSAFFSGSETALFSLTNFQRKRISAKNPHTSKVISTLLESPRRTLATLLIGNMLVNIAAASIATVLAITLFGKNGVAISIVVMTFLLLVFGEVAPKTFAIRNSESFSLSCSLPLHIFGKLIWPLRRILRSVADIFISLFAVKKETKPYITQQELKALMAISEKEGVIEKEEEQMIRSIFDLGERNVDEIMTPRVDVAGCEKEASSDELIEVMKNSKHTKIPIYDDTIDHVTGVVYTNEFMLQPKKDFSSYVKEPLFVPETETIDDLLVKFQSTKTYIAVVIDEFGGTSGIVTLEDVLEEIVGEIKDEYDREVTPIEKETPNTYTVSGKTSIRDVNDELGLKLPMEDVTTINGLVLMLFGRVPRPGEVIRFKGVMFQVLEVRENMATKVQIKV